MDTSFKGKVAVVTGAGQGIGRATALAFAAAGAKVVASDIAADAIEETGALGKKAGGEIIVLRTDVSKPDEIKAMIERTLSSYGKLDYAVNNAADNGSNADLHETPDSEWEHILGVNLSGVFQCMKYEIPPMLKNGGGAIVNLSSVVGLASSTSAPYGASKSGVIALTRTAAKQYARRGIRVNAVCPGSVDTPFTLGLPANKRYVGPVGRYGQSEEVAAAILWLCSDASSFVTGDSMLLDGGWMVR